MRFISIVPKNTDRESCDPHSRAGSGGRLLPVAQLTDNKTPTEAPSVAGDAKRTLDRHLPRPGLGDCCPGPVISLAESDWVGWWQIYDVEEKQLSGENPYR